MYLLNCPGCQSSIHVSPSQAGDQTTCPSCQESVQIPKLGELRLLPLAEQADGPGIASVGSPTESNPTKRIGFVVCGVIATASLLIAGFCGIRWSLIDVPTNTEQHIAEFREQYKLLNPAELIREFEQMETNALDLTVPMQYKTIEVEKRGWGRNAVAAAAVAGLAILVAITLSIASRGNRRPTADT